MSRIRTYPPLVVAFTATLLANLLGAVVAMATNLTGPADTVLNGSAISAPGPFVLVQALFVALALRSSRRISAAAAGGVVALLGTVGIVSGFGDGSYVKHLTPSERCIQAALVGAILMLIITACQHVTRRLSRRVIAA